MIYRPAIVAFALILLSACATPAVDRKTAGFDAVKYSNDLEACRGGNVASFTLQTVGGTLVGSATGVMSGAFYGAILGDAGEGTVIGAIVGGVAGAGIGAGEFLTNQGNTIDNCLRERGYDILTS